MFIQTTGLLLEKRQNNNVKNYISSKRGVCRPVYTNKKLQKWFAQNIHTKLKWVVVVSKGKKTQWPIYQRLMDICNVICNHLIECSNWSVLTDLMLFVYIIERINQIFKWILLTVDELHCIYYMEHNNVTIISTSCSSLLLQKWARLGGCRLYRPSGLSRLSHCFIPHHLASWFVSKCTAITHVNRYRWGYTW